MFSTKTSGEAGRRLVRSTFLALALFATSAVNAQTVTGISLSSLILPEGGSGSILFKDNPTGGATGSVSSSSLSAGQSLTFTWGSATNPAYRVRTTNTSSDNSGTLSGPVNASFASSLGALNFDPTTDIGGFFFDGTPDEFNGTINPASKTIIVTSGGDTHQFVFTLNGQVGPTSNTNTAFLNTLSGTLLYSGVVPEPGTLVLGLLALPAVALLRRRR